MFGARSTRKGLFFVLLIIFSYSPTSTARCARFLMEDLEENESFLFFFLHFHCCCCCCFGFGFSFTLGPGKTAGKRLENGWNGWNGAGVDVGNCRPRSLGPSHPLRRPMGSATCNPLGGRTRKNTHETRRGKNKHNSALCSETL